jgi:hypothetical protein
VGGLGNRPPFHVLAAMARGRRRIFSEDSQYGADTGVIREEVHFEMEGQPTR